jgi:hypothetical protein
MCRVFTSVLVLLSATVAIVQGGQPTPAEQFRAILKEYQTAASGGDGTDEGRKKVIERVDRMRDDIALKFLKLADQYPKDPVAVDAAIQAIWMVNSTSFPTGGPDSPGNKAMATLLRDHIGSDKIGPICLRVASGFRREHELFLRAILEKSAHKEVRALACLALAQLLKDRTARIEWIGTRPDLLKEYESHFGAGIVAEFRREDGARVIAEIESLLERAIRDFPDETIPYEGTVAAKARAELFEFRHLRVGKSAPDIEGEDQNGVRFRLSDYRGKVVLLDFWNQY